MSKSFDIVMAGLISGIVALTTSFLGVAGTVIGAVLGAILYQVLSIFVKEPLESTTIRRVENELVYIIPLILIAIFLVIFIVALLDSYTLYFPDFLEFFRQLEEITNNNLVRFMGIGLIVMGIYPLIHPKTIERKYGAIIFVSGIVLLVRGLLDLNIEFFYYYSEIFQSFDIILMVCVFLAVLFVIIKIFLESMSLYINRKKNNNNLENSDHIANENTAADNNLKVSKLDLKNRMEYFEGHYKYLNGENYRENNNNKNISSQNNEFDLEKTKNYRKNSIKSNSNRNNIKNNIKNNNINNDNIKNNIANNIDSNMNNNLDNNIDNKPTITNVNNNKTIKTSKTSTMSKNRKYFKK
ncbi:hypothetical protein ALNOE001_09180 [Candidatus Methanobinarius endosymbioticus]|uniref:Uncharacterized protein n=1 Tax=Candidatus Methanobinarius endosymbioticus TaxID=2006182 RepID=A0A366MBD8_9EURY|nr:hypothetical protein ALNOE001_09180 [Candidatus Methanobinarius endosymbioticus]